MKSNDMHERPVFTVGNFPLREKGKVNRPFDSSICIFCFCNSIAFSANLSPENMLMPLHLTQNLIGFYVVYYFLFICHFRLQFSLVLFNIREKSWIYFFPASRHPYLRLFESGTAISFHYYCHHFISGSTA